MCPVILCFSTCVCCIFMVFDFASYFIYFKAEIIHREGGNKASNPVAFLCFIHFFLSTVCLKERGKYVAFVIDLFYNKTTEQPLTPESYTFPWRPRWVQHSAVLSVFPSAVSKTWEERTEEGFDAAAVPRERALGREMPAGLQPEIEPRVAVSSVVQKPVLPPCSTCCCTQPLKGIKCFFCRLHLLIRESCQCLCFGSVPYCTLAFKIHCMPSVCFFFFGFFFIATKIPAGLWCQALIKTDFVLCTYNAELVIVAALRAHLFLEPPV